MTGIVTLEEIQEVAPDLNPAAAMRQGFIAYSQGRVVVPPVGELLFENPPGDVHIKYGYIRGDDYYVIKIASGFYDNFKLGLPSSSGLMLLFSQKTGQLECVLLDGGYLTDLRTAAAGQVAAELLAPRNIQAVGVFGSGVQARLQTATLASVTDCRDVFVLGRNQDRLQEYRTDLEGRGWRVEIARDAEQVMSNCNLIITATPSKTPLITADLVRAGQHITAVGSDTPEKQELDPAVLGKADLVVADSIPQCLERGEIFQAIKAGRIDSSGLVELGRIAEDPGLGRTSEDQITVADLTGVAVQDVQIATAVFQAVEARKGSRR